MANFKIVVSDPKTKKAYQKEIEQGQSGLLGKKIGEKFSGSHLGLPGYELEITGGSDKEGFPMRRDVEGPGRKKILLSHPPGFHPKSRGRRKRKSIRGNTVSQQVSQINIKIVTHGAKSAEELMGAKSEGKPASGEKSEAKEEHKEKKAEHHEKPHKEEAAEKPKEIHEKPAHEKEHAHKEEHKHAEAKEE